MDTLIPIPGLDGYFLRSDRTVWSRKFRGRPSHQPKPEPPPRLVATQQTRSGETFCRVWDSQEQKTVAVSVDRLYEQLCNPGEN